MLEIQLSLCFYDKNSSSYFLTPSYLNFCVFVCFMSRSHTSVL